MQKNSIAYIVGFALVVTLICGVSLALVSISTETDRNTNVRVEKKSNILATVKVAIDKGPNYNSEVESTYADKIEEIVVNEKGEVLEGVKAFDIDFKAENAKKKADESYEMKLPVFIYTSNEGDKSYVLPLAGNGLWGPVWGYISLEDDYNTVYGVKFDHASETPGLGAEITTEWFQSQFEEKKVYNETSDDVALTILKGKGNQLTENTVDGMSGATITGTGVDEMLKKDIKKYKAYFNKLKKS